MIQDYMTRLSAQQAITVSAQSTNILDLDPLKDKGKGEPVKLFCQVDEAFTAAGAATLTIAIRTDDNSGMSSPTTLYTTVAIGKATLVAGYKVFVVDLPEGCERYLDAYFTVATGPMTAGKLTLGIVKDYQSNFNV